MSVKEFLVVFAWGFIPAALWLLYSTLEYSWSQRWAQKFRGPKPDDSNWDDNMFHDSDLEAFYYRLIDDAKNNFRWSVITVTPFIAGVAVSIAYWAIYYSVEVLA